MDNDAEIINKAKNSFNKALSVSAYGDAIRDDEHLKRIIQSIKVKPGGNILDLGTGAGYIAFSLAKIYAGNNITGLDIADSIIAANNKKAVENGLKNLRFLSYDGTALPFEPDSFNAVVTRYALHHFPNIKKSFDDIYKIIEPGGQFFISDPTPIDDDEDRIIDKYMSVKNDGHVKFYTLKELESSAADGGFKLDAYFYSDMRAAFPPRDEYVRLTSTVDSKIIDGYNIKVIGQNVRLTLKILNVSFIKTGKE